MSKTKSRKKPVWIYIPDGFEPLKILPTSLHQHADSALYMLHRIIWGKVMKKANESGYVNLKTDYLRDVIPIVTSLESFYPCTLEAWISTEDHGREQFVIGSDTPNAWGIGIGVRNSNPMVETIGGGFHAPKTEFQLGKWTHLAAVFDRQQTRLYVDGELVGAGPPTERPRGHSVFVIGNLGQQHKTHYFKGRIRSVKVSNRQLYTEKNFVPNETLVSNEGTLLLYNSDSVVGDRIVDQSGNGNDGLWTSSR